ncbi:MAG: 50S ribosomal protein L17 [Candidatus Sungbacteria bacterium]|nr:50S ribosomal protein L17 [Candidatus Sungbacteria bacterium]
MKHLKKGRKFSRRSNQRQALLKGLATSFFLYEKITTTQAKAKELRPFVEKCITRAKQPTISNRRLLGKILSAAAVKKAMDAASLHISRPGGYTRITKLGVRKSDSARMAMIELIRL